MKKDIVKFLCDLEGYKTAVKNFHFSAASMSEHKLMDEIADTIASNQDEIGEICQGIHGQFNKYTIKGNEYKLDTSKKFVNDVINSINGFYKKIQGEKYVGLRSVVETFIGDMNKYVYLLNLCLKEDFKRYYKNKINEEKNNMALYENGYQRGMKSKSVRLTEKELNECINEAIRTVMTNFINEIGNTDNFYKLLGKSSGYNDAVGNTKKAGRAMSLSNKLQKHANGGKLYDTSSEESAAQYRKNSKSFTNAYNQGWDEGRAKMRESIETEAKVQGGMYNDKELNYTHFAVNKMTNLIVDGWNYSGYDSEELKHVKNNSFNDDLMVNGFNPKMYKFLSRKECLRRGLNPNNKQIWSKTGVYPIKQELQMNKQGQNPYEAAFQEHPDWFIEN